jgi:ribosomal-protein-alanine N-acetyltransferase
MSFRLETERLILSLPDASAAPEAVAYFLANQEHLAPTDPVLPSDFRTLAFWENRLVLSQEEFECDQSLRLFMARKDQPTRFIGVVNFTQIVRGPMQACYLGYSIAHDQQGLGFMNEALRTAVPYVFNELHLHRIMANYRPDNSRSGRVLARLGFRIEGTAEHYLYIAGTWRAHVLTSLTNDKWTPREEDRALFTP